MSGSWYRIALFAGLSVLGLGVGVAYYRIKQGAGVFYVGVLRLPAATLAELEPTLQQVAQALEAIPVHVDQAPQQTYPLSAWGGRLDVPATKEALCQKWEATPFWERLTTQPRVQVAPRWQVNPEAFERTLARYRSLERPPQDARLQYRDGQIALLPEKAGLQIDPKGTMRALTEALEYASLETPVEFALATETLRPRITAEHLRVITGEMGRYTTRFPSYQVHRNHNIRLAAQALNGKILMPGERLSYNATVDKRTLQQGFRLAPVIIRGEKRLGVGGGICQVSSTLYNAALLADLKIVRRANHSIPITYVPPGRDATVTDTGLDLVIENPHPHPIAIVAEVGRSSITVRVLGVPNPARRVILRTEQIALKSPPIKEEPDPSLPAGVRKVAEKGAAGVKVILWRLVYENGQLIRRERVATSIYRAQPRIIRVGTKAVASSQPAPDL